MRRYAVVFDIDETLLCSKRRKACAGMRDFDAYDVHSITVENVAFDVLVRPWARRLLYWLSHQAVDIYLLTAGSNEYCQAVMALFNGLATAAGETPPIAGGASSRTSDDPPAPKTFAHVLPAGVPMAHALAIDNDRQAWARSDRAHVLPAVDWHPNRPATHDALIDVWLLLAHALEALDGAGEDAHAGDVVDDLLEDLVKGSIVGSGPSAADRAAVRDLLLAPAICARRPAERS